MSTGDITCVRRRTDLPEQGSPTCGGRITSTATRRSDGTPDLQWRCESCRQEPLGAQDGPWAVQT